MADVGGTHMGEQIFEILRAYFVHHGYLTVGVVLLLENAGIPVPGETALLFASFLAFSERRLQLLPIIVVATLAATLGDNLGYWVGLRGGPHLLERYRHIFRLPQSHIERGERLFAEHGPVAVFFARFVFGMRIVTGPLAGVLRMEWRRFALFNFLGAITWVTTISCIGFFFGSNWKSLVRTLHHLHLGVGVLLLAGVVIWLAWRNLRRDRGPAIEGLTQCVRDPSLGLPKKHCSLAGSPVAKAVRSGAQDDDAQVQDSGRRQAQDSSERQA
jgi:membrane protein DedA with SNARE-associated domain